MRLALNKTPFGIFLKIKFGWLDEFKRYEKVLVGLKKSLNSSLPLTLFKVIFKSKKCGSNSIYLNLLKIWKYGK